MTKEKTIKIILWTIVIAVLVGIFCFSAQNSDQSNETSGRFLRTLLAPFPFFKSMDLTSQDALVESIMTVVRKMAHFSIYAFLGFWMHFLIISYNVKRSLLFTVLFSCIYAVSDEIHQYFVPGRSCQATDVCIDTLGAFTGALAGSLLIFIWQKFRKNKADSR